MSLELQTEHENLLIVRASGKLTKGDYEQFVPKVEQIIRDQKKISILFDMQDFHGLEPAAVWEDAIFAVHHFSDIERLAVIGDKKWQKGMALFCKPFTRAEVRYFTRDKSAQAHQWLQEQPAVR